MRFASWGLVTLFTLGCSDDASRTGDASGATAASTSGSTSGPSTGASDATGAGAGGDATTGSGGAGDVGGGGANPSSATATGGGGSGPATTGSGGGTTGSGGDAGAGGGGTGDGGGGAAPIDPSSFEVTLAGLLDGDSTDWEQARDVAFDETGAMYVVGGTSSSNFPVTVGAHDTTYNTGGSELGSRGQSDAFVTKIDASGAIVWSTYLGSPNYDRAYAVEVDAGHDVYVAGRAGNGFPTTPNALQSTFAGDDTAAGSYGNQDGFVAKLSADGSTLLWSTYFGESGPGFVRDIAVDAAGRVHVAASSVTGDDMNAKVTAGASQSTRRGVADTFYARLSSDGASVEYGTYLGGNDGAAYSSNPSVRVQPDGTAFILTLEPGAGAPTTPGAFQPSSAGGDDFLIAKFDPAGAMTFCTYLGGSANEVMDTHSLVLGAGGVPIVAAGSKSPNFPVTDGSGHAGASDVVVSVLSTDGTSLLRSTRFGGSGGESGEGVGIDGAGNIYVTGFTNSPTLPVTASALSPTSAGSLEGFLAVLSEDLATRHYLSYDGLRSEYGNRSSIVMPDGRWAVVGAVWQTDPFPATPGLDAQINGLHGAFFRLLTPN